MTHENLIAELEEKIDNLANIVGITPTVTFLTKVAKHLQELRSELATEQREHAEDVQTLTDLRNEIERLKGKVVSPEVTTLCYCEDCGAATRMGRHLDIDCKTIQDLSKFKASMTTAIAQAVSDALAQADVQHKADVAELQAEITRKDRQLEKSECEYQELRAKLSIVNKFMATNYEDSGVAMFQSELIAEMKGWK